MKRQHEKKFGEGKRKERVRTKKKEKGNTESSEKRKSVRGGGVGAR